MRGTVVCGVADSEEGRSAITLAAELSERLGLRLVLAHVADGIALPGEDESVSSKANREGAARLVSRLAAEHDLSGRAEQRSAVGEPATLLGRIAAEEAADVIVVGATRRGVLRPRFESRLARELETETPVPVVIAPPRKAPATRASAEGER
jgi:nucleotide-binding universal stress UspA family protein